MQDEISFGTYSYRVYEKMLNRLRNMKETPRNFFPIIFYQWDSAAREFLRNKNISGSEIITKRQMNETSTIHLKGAKHFWFSLSFLHHILYVKLSKSTKYQHAQLLPFAPPPPTMENKRKVFRIIIHVENKWIWKHITFVLDFLYFIFFRLY